MSWALIACTELMKKPTFERRCGEGAHASPSALEALSLPIRLLGEPKGKRTMTQRTHLAVPVSERDHRQGPATAAVTLVQYGDSILREAADKDYQLTVLSDGCVDNDEEVQRVLLSKVFPRQADVVQASAWSARLKAEAGIP